MQARYIRCPRASRDARRKPQPESHGAMSGEAYVGTLEGVAHRDRAALEVDIVPFEAKRVT